VSSRPGFLGARLDPVLFVAESVAYDALVAKLRGPIIAYATPKADDTSEPAADGAPPPVDEALPASVQAASASFKRHNGPELSREETRGRLALGLYKVMSGQAYGAEENEYAFHPDVMLVLEGFAVHGVKGGLCRPLLNPAGTALAASMKPATVFRGAVDGKTYRADIMQHPMPAKAMSDPARRDEPGLVAERQRMAQRVLQCGFSRIHVSGALSGQRDAMRAAATDLARNNTDLELEDVSKSLGLRRLSGSAYQLVDRKTCSVHTAISTGFHPQMQVMHPRVAVHAAKQADYVARVLSQHTAGKPQSEPTVSCLHYLLAINPRAEDQAALHGIDLWKEGRASEILLESPIAFADLDPGIKDLLADAADITTQEQLDDFDPKRQEARRRRKEDGVGSAFCVLLSTFGTDGGE
jgi:hypothetical protein